MVRICSTHGGGRRKIHTKPWSEKSEHLQDLGRDGRMVLILIFRKKKQEDVDLDHLVQDHEQWWTFVKKIIKLQVP